jgi:hypothetical protein
MSREVHHDPAEHCANSVRNFRGELRRIANFQSNKNFLKHITGFCLSSVALLGCLCCGGGSGGGGGPTGLDPSATSLPFGNVLDDKTSSQNINLTNNENSDVTISAVAVTGAGFSASGISNGTIVKAGQTATLKVTFAPTTGGAVNGAGVTITSDAINSPAAISLSGAGIHWAELTWQASPTNGVTYNVFRGTSPGGESTTPLNPSPISGTTYMDETVTPGQNYYYTVEAVDSGGSSAPTNEGQGDIPTP